MSNISKLNLDSANDKSSKDKTKTNSIIQSGTTLFKPIKFNYHSNLGLPTSYSAPYGLHTTYFKRPYIYHDYEIWGFLSPIYMKLKHAVKIRRTPYGFEINEYKKEDCDQLDKVFDIYLPNIKVTPEKWYINNFDFKIYDKENNLLNDLLENQEWIITMEIRGLKVKNGQFSPVWRLFYIQQC